MKKLTVVASALFALCPIAARVEAQNCGSEPYIPCSAKVECIQSEGWVVTEGLPEGTPCSTTYGGPINGTCSASVKHGALPVSVSCVPSTLGTYSVGGTVSGLTGGSVVIEDNNNGQPLTVSNGPFTFPAKLASNKGYSVTVHQQPAGQVCTIANPVGPPG